jgi:hypothetical protein
LTSTISESLIKAVVMDLNCNVCGFETRLKNDLAKHVKTMHSGVNDFQCDKCDYQTSTPQRLTIHVNNLHVKVPMKNATMPVLLWLSKYFEGTRE